MARKTTTKKPKAPKADAPISTLMLRLDPEDGRRLETLHSRVPIASRASLALAALRLGLQELEQDPTKLIAKG